MEVSYCDLHSHILPGIDDGAPDPDTSLAMIRALGALGFETICATPHQKTGHFLPTQEQRDNAFMFAQNAAQAAGISADLVLAAENMWDSTFYQRCESEQIPSYDRGAAFLFELPIQAQLPLGLLQRIFSLCTKGYLPVLAHPERYQPLWKDDDLVATLRDQCALVVDLGALAGYHGRNQAKMARKLVKNGWAHAVASDAHSLQDVRGAAEGMAWIEKEVGVDGLSRLLRDGPRTILAGQHPES